MAQDELLKVRCSSGLADRARAAAGPRGLSVFVRDAMLEKLEREAMPRLPLDEVAVPDVLADVRARSGRAPRREPCVHRLSPAQFCKTCDA